MINRKKEKKIEIRHMTPIRNNLFIIHHVLTDSN